METATNYQTTTNDPGDRLEELEKIKQKSWDLWKKLDSLGGTLLLIENALDSALPSKENYDRDCAIFGSVRHCRETAYTLRDFLENTIDYPLRDLTK